MLGLLPSVLWAQNTPVDSTKTKTKEIEEVVITGFQKIEKSKITSSVDVVKMKDIEQKAVASIDQMLQGIECQVCSLRQHQERQGRLRLLDLEEQPHLQVLPIRFG